MTNNLLHSLYRRFQSTLITPEDSFIVYAATADGGHFNAYPMASLTDTFATHLPELSARFAVKIFGSSIDAAIEMAPWPQDEVDLQFGYTVRIVQSAPELLLAADDYQRAAFLRDEQSLVMWNDYEDGILSIWSDIARRLQNRFASVVPHPSPIAGLPGGIDHYPQADSLEAFVHHSDGALPILNEFAYLVTVPSPFTPFPPSSVLDPAPFPWAYPESPPLGSLQLELQSTSSPSSDAPSSSFRDTPFTIDLPAISPAPINSGNLVEDEDNASDLSTVDSLQSYESSVEVPLAPTVTVGSSSSFRRHSFTETRNVIGVKRESVDYDHDYVENLNDSSFDTTTTTDTPSEGVSDANEYVPHMSKRRRSFREVVTSASAPALFPIPLPDVEHDDDVKPQVTTTTTTVTPAPISLSIGTTTTSRGPTRRGGGGNKGGRRRGGGNAGARPKKGAPCDYCEKPFTRVQDAQRHMMTSCPDSPKKVGVECPECNAVLSRPDAAQRHWRGHENPRCPTPEWMTSRRSRT